jgi:hypothetical protein
MVINDLNDRIVEELEPGSNRETTLITRPRGLDSADWP